MINSTPTMRQSLDCFAVSALLCAVIDKLMSYIPPEQLAKAAYSVKDVVESHQSFITVVVADDLVPSVR